MGIVTKKKKQGNANVNFDRLLNETFVCFSAVEILSIDCKYHNTTVNTILTKFLMSYEMHIIVKHSSLASQ